jgi:hypothetical protein
VPELQGQNMSNQGTSKVISILLAAVIAALGLIALFQVKILHDTAQKTVSEWRSVPVEPPRGLPPVSQESINLALVVYGITVPDSAEHPVLNKTLEDRGLSTRRAWMQKISVEIGPSAFSSWGLLASTLAHELEIHCHQNFLLISVMDVLGLDGTKLAERQAYLHEIRNAKRFGLTQYHADLIADTMSYYYDVDMSETKNNRLFGKRLGQSLGRWLARTAITAN